MKDTFLRFNWLAFLLFGVFLLAFVLLFSGFFNGFPFGLDAAQHIVWARSFAENAYPTNLYHGGFVPSSYPLPEVLFAMLNQFYGESWVAAFPVVISFFHVLSSAVVFLILKKYFGLIPAIIAGILSVVMPFTLDELYIGIFAQVFGKALFLLFVYLILQRKYILAGIFFVISYFVHPFVLLLSVSFLMIFLPLLLIEKRAKVLSFLSTRKSLVVISLFVFAGGIFLLFLFPENRFIDVLQSDQNIIQGGPAYGFLSIVRRNIAMPILYLFAAFGYFSLFFFKEKHFSSHVYIVLAVLPFVVIYYVFGNVFLIDVDPYRFLSFLEVLVAVFVGIFSFFLLKKLPNIRPVILLVFVALILWSVVVNLSYTQSIAAWYSRDGSPDRLPKAELKAFDWISKNIPEDVLICSDYRWGYWIPTITKRSVVLSEFVPSCPAVYFSDTISEITAEISERGYGYVFVSSESELNSIIPDHPDIFSKRYAEDDIYIYEILRK